MEVGRTESFRTAPKLVGTDGEWAKKQVDHAGFGDTRFVTLELHMDKFHSFYM